MEDVKLAGTIALFTFLLALAAWCAARPAPEGRYIVHSCPVVDPRILEMQRVLDRLRDDVETMERQVSATIDALIRAPTHVDREAAKARLQELRRQKVELERRLAAARARVERM